MHLINFHRKKIDPVLYILFSGAVTPEVSSQFPVIEDFEYPYSETFCTDKIGCQILSSNILKGISYPIRIFILAF